MDDRQHLGSGPCSTVCASRRSLLGVAGTVAVTAALTGCQVYGTPQPAAPAPPAAPTGSGSAAQSTESTPGGAPEPADAAPVLASLDDIPVGGGRVFAAENVVVTQPEPGTVRAFSATCTHQGCAVNEVANGTINCPCHGSRFSVGDGSVTAGPASRPLPPVAVSVDGGAIRLG